MNSVAGQRAIRVERVKDYWRADFFAMGSPCAVLSEADSRADAADAAGIAAAEAWRIEDKFSRYLKGNIVDRINTADGAEVSVDEETARLLDFSAELHELSDGRFDITSGVLRRVWTFDGSDNVPEAGTVANVLERVGWTRVKWRDGKISMPAGMEIDFGGVAKEYAVDRATALVRDYTPSSCLINFGGDLAVSIPPRKQKAWQIGIETDAAIHTGPTVLALQAGALATSGDSRRYLVRDRVRYGHIIDPRTGWPVAGAPVSVTVAADSCIEAGMVCTMAMLAGRGAEDFLQAQDLKYWCARV